MSATRDFARRVATVWPLQRAMLLHAKPGDFVAIKLALDDVAYDVLLDCGIRIQPLPIWETEWAHPESYSNPRLLENIAHEGLAL